MPSPLERREIQVLIEVIKEYLTDLRTEILDASDPAERKALEEKEGTLRGILADLGKAGIWTLTRGEK